MRPLALLLIGAFAVPGLAQSDQLDSLIEDYRGSMPGTIEVSRCEIKKRKGQAVVTNDCEKEIAVFDDDGKVIEYRRTDDGRLEDRMTYDYDSMGNLITITDFDAKGLTQKTTHYEYEYDSTGAIVARTFREKCSFYKTYRRETEIVRDSFGNIIRCVRQTKMTTVN
jgi:YD repeat-containing protein